MSNTMKLLHVRDENELAVLKMAMPAIVENSKIVFGLTVPTQVALLSAIKDGEKITTTGLPLDIASQVQQEVTVVRAWDKALPGGGRSTGCQAPKTIAAVEIMDSEAWAEVIASDAYKKAVGAGGTPATEDIL